METLPLRRISTGAADQNEPGFRVFTSGEVALIS
jgi:hypothetical protein